MTALLLRALEQAGLSDELFKCLHHFPTERAPTIQTHFAKKVDTWRAFKGLANQIEAEEFFRITGYTEEANKVKKNLEDANGKIGMGWVLYIGGLVMSIIPKTETEDLGYGVTYDTVTYPYFLPGTIAWAGGLWLVYDGMLKKLKPVAPYQSAADIAEEYNKGIIAEITR